MLSKGTEVDRYIVEALLGEGGMAAVYRVRHKTLGTRHALKVLQIANAEIRDRTIQEGQVQARLRHPHVVSVTDVLDIDGSPGLLMELVRGPALDHWLYQYKPSIDEALTIFRGIVAGVGYAHAKGLVHRDLKSANIMLQIDDDVGVVPKVADFGLAKVSRPDGRKTRSGTTMGTPTFMAPEQIRDASTVDRRADLYSLGCILYELVCGRTPHVGDDVIELFAQVASGRYPHPREFRPDVPNGVVDVIEALVEVNASYRLPDCASILELLEGGERNTFAAPLELGQELPPPRPMPDAGVTVLEHGSAGAARAALFLDQLSTPPLVAPADPGSMAPVDADFGEPTSQMDLDKNTPVAEAPRRRVAGALVGMAGLLVVGGSLVLGGLVLGVGLWMRDTSDGTITVEEEPQPAPAPEPSPEPAPAPDPTPEPSQEPSSTEPNPTTEPQSTTGPKPTPPPPTTPRPQQPAPVKPRPAPAPSGATFTVQGVSDAVLVDGSATYRAGEAVPAGRYTVMAAFDGGQRRAAGKVTMPASGAKVLACDAAFQQCKLR